MPSVEIVCSPREERAILEQILASGDVVPLLPIPANPKSPPLVDLQILPPWPEEAALWFWCRDAGPLRWLKKRPGRADLGTAESFKTNILRQDRWDRERPPRGAALLDPKKSPILAYGRFHEWRAVGPVTLDFTSRPGAGARWARRMLSWIYKNSTRLQDMTLRSPLIVTEDETPAIVVAFPEGMKLLRQGKFMWESGGVKPAGKRPPKAKIVAAEPKRRPSRECVHTESVPADEENRQLTLWWVFPPSVVRNSARKFLSLLERVLPTMLSARFNDYGGNSGTPRSKPDRFETAWREATIPGGHRELSWRSPQFYATLEVLDEPEVGSKRQPIVVLRIDYEPAALGKDPSILEALEALFPAVSEQLRATYGGVQVVDREGRAPIYTRGTWTGIPRLHPWRTWFGGPYPGLVRSSLKGFDVQATPGGFLLRMSGPPAADADWCGRYPRLPERLIAGGTSQYLEPASFIPRIGK